MAPDRESAYEASDNRAGHDQAADRIAGGTALGLEGLRSAIERLHRANEQILSGSGAAPSAIALGEALFWIAALDDDFKTSAGPGVYFKARSEDHRGRTVGGLVYARNMLGHGLGTTAGMQFEVHPPTIVQEGSTVTVKWARLPGREYSSENHGTVFSTQLLWVALGDLPEAPEDPHGRHEWYAKNVAGAPLSSPLEVAREWFEECLKVMA
jgi:hypothetical protein